MISRRSFLKLTGSILLALGSGISLAERAIKPDLHQPPHNTHPLKASRHWNDPYTRQEASYMRLASNWCYRTGNRLKSL